MNESNLSAAASAAQSGDWLNTALGEVWMQHAIASLAFVLVIVLLRTALVRLIVSRQSITVENRRRWLVNIRNSIIFALIIGLIIIWASELRHVALSLAAIAVAIVIATKELLLCFSGAFFRASTNAYTVGDCISVNDLRGDVIDQNLFGTTILELGPGQNTRQYTGRTVILPNSLLLTHPVISETYMGEYIVHFITIPLSVRDDWRQAEAILLRVAAEECAPFLEAARQHMISLEKKHWIDTPSVDPRVTFYLHDQGIVKVLLRVPAPARKKGRVEQAIIRRFLDEFRFADATDHPSVPLVTGGGTASKFEA
ncbi:mechanosensitive ion channel [bacterium]|nr:mechanosensitive ion channel [bacterium]